MPSLANRAMLLDLTAYVVDNNVRRGVLQVSANIQTTEQEIYERSKTIQPEDDWTFESLTVNSGTVIRTQNGPVNAVITKGLETWTLTIDSLFVITDEIGDIVFTNPSTTRAVLVRIIQA